MIKNERQYKISKAQLAKFRADAGLLEASRDGLAQLHLRANVSLQDELAAEIAEYEALRDGRVAAGQVQDFGELPRALIRARIASRLTHKDLAERLGVKEQQVQRWESEDYRGASLEALRAVADSLGLAFSSEVVFAVSQPRLTTVRKRLGKVGVGEMLLSKILSPDAKAALFEEIPNKSAAARAIIEVARVLKLSLQELLSDDPLRKVASPARFKTISTASKEGVHAFAAYAHYVAGLVVGAAGPPPSEPLPASWQELRRRVLSKHGKVTFESVLEVAWDCGVVVIPMRGAGAFHGAVWKIGGRIAIVLKQTNEKAARWLFDLLHEIAHAALGHVTEDQAVIEDHELGPTGSAEPEEVEANEWAEDFLFGGESEEVEDACVSECGGDLRRLASVIQSVASQFDIDAGVIANHMAWRLSSQGQKWWGTAENLQKGSSDPYESATRKFLAGVSLEALNDFDKKLLLRAIAKREPIQR